MRKNIPAIFFVIASLVNWAGKYFGISEMAAATKPALMPLLALSVLAYAVSRRLDKRKLALLVSAELFGCVGDVCLLFDGLPPFAGGIVAFLIGHILYLSLFGRAAWEDMDGKSWLGGVLVMAGVVYGLVRLLGISGQLLIPMVVYAFVLITLVFCTFCGLVRNRNKGTWGLLFVGALLFAVSDSILAAGTFGMHFPHQEFVVMFTYVTAQAFLAMGSVRLAKV